MSAEKTSKAAEYKKKEVEGLVKLIQNHKVIGILNMEGMPAPQLQRMRAQFRGKALIYMSKLRLIKFAVDKAKESKKGLEKLGEFLKGMPALLLTNENPFKIASQINKSKTPAPAKAGQEATKEIIIPPGPTPFAPGPIISELSSIGLKTGVEGGKVAIKEEFVAAKEGDKIPAKVADVLTKLGIEPMEVGLNLVAIYEDGTVYKKDVLSLDEETFLGMIKEAAAQSKALAVEISYAAKEIITLMLGKAHIIAKKVNDSLPEAEIKASGEKKKVEEGKKEEINEEKKVPSAHELAKKPAKVKDNMEKNESNGSEKRIKTKISEDFKEDVQKEKERRDENFDKSTKEVEELTEQLKKKGTLRERGGG